MIISQETADKSLALIKMQKERIAELKSDLEYACESIRALEETVGFFEDKNERLADEVDRLRSGFQGACYACEPVGELNVKLQAENKALREALMKIITEQEKYNRGVMTVRSTEIAIRDAAKLLGQKHYRSRESE